MSLTSRVPHLMQTQDFNAVSESSGASLQHKLNLAYHRACTIGRNYNLSLHDVLNLSSKFWDLHMDPIHCLDQAATTLLTIQYNLAAGTLAPFALKQPSLMPLMNKILDFDVSAQYLLTEIGHGLDAPNLETVCHLLSNGSFDLHTPNDHACKYMPPTGPVKGFPRVGIVFAKLVVGSEDRGVRPFIVNLGDGIRTAAGVSIRMLPPRGGTSYVDHAITRFTHVCLPSSAVLGSLAAPKNRRTHFMDVIWRVSVGSLALSTLSVPFLSVGAYILARYSMRRTVMAPNGIPRPIWTFRTQHGPVMHALAQAFVSQAHASASIKYYTDTSLSTEVRSGVAAAAKAAMMNHAVTSMQRMGERMGAHGLFEHNDLLSIELVMRSTKIAEGDVLVLSIRLANELLIGRYELPTPRFPDSLLALHEAGLFNELQSIVTKAGGHRAKDIESILLPQCLPFVEAIGHRMAYDAAVSQGVDQALIDVYEAGVILLDSSWYSENLGLKRREQLEREERAITAALPHIEKYLEATNAKRFVTAPSDGSEGLKCVLGNSEGLIKV